MTSPFAIPQLPQSSGNPVLDEIDGLSPHAQAALHMAHSTVLGQAQQPQLGATGGHTPDPAQPASLTMPSKSPVPTLGAPMSSSQQQQPPIAPHSVERGLSAPAPAMPSLTPNQAELGRLQQTGSGISQIHNRVGLTFAQIGDAVGGALFPGIEQRLPGTEGHHDMLVNHAAHAVTGDDVTAKNAADLNSAQAGIDSTRAQTGHTLAETDAIKNPPGSVKEEQLLYDKNGSAVGYRDAKGTYYGPDDPNLPPGVSGTF